MNGSNEFINTANKLLNINSAIIIHPYVKGSPAESLELLTGRDSFDKSDVYFCNKEFESEVIRNMLILGNSDIPAYINYMANNSDKVIGVSLKKPKGSLQITNYYIKEDVTTKEDKYFTGDVVWKTSQSGSDNETQYIRFSTVDGPLELQIRSGGKGRPGVMNFKYPSAAAQKGGAKTVISNLLKNEPELFDKIIKPLDKEIRNFKLSAKNFMS